MHTSLLGRCGDDNPRQVRKHYLAGASARQGAIWVVALNQVAIVAVTQIELGHRQQITPVPHRLSCRP